jgi:hypothetical protein
VSTSEELVYRTPTEAERAFLRIVTRGHAQLNAQAEYCDVADYDPTGWLDVRANGGPSAVVPRPFDGPAFSTDDPKLAFIEILLWVDEHGMLKTVEIVVYGEGEYPLWDPIRGFADAEREGRLNYRSSLEGPANIVELSRSAHPTA